MSVTLSRRKVSRLLLGNPLKTDEAAHQTISKRIGLAVFASDALSSVAYATEAILFVLITAGLGSLWLSVPVSLAIVFLLTVLTISYRQTIFAYPSGGGAYIVARDNIGEGAAQVAGAALLTDYILTVAVSISAGADQIASAIPAAHDHKVLLCLAMILGMTVINLRGVKESGRVLALPTYFFIAMVLLTLGVGAVKYFTGTLTTVTGVEMIRRTAEPIGLFLILHAFSSGCTALTGVEAISNGITAFKEPRSRNAAATMAVMSLLLGIMFVGITLMARAVGALPSERETVIYQIGRAVFDGVPFLYYLLIAATTVILVLAANTSYAGFPRLGALQAADGFLPRQLTVKGNRLTFDAGIILLAAAAALLIVLFNAETEHLIPLYAIGVFLSFTLSQTGMVIRWRRTSKLKPGETIRAEHSTLEHDPRWRIKQFVNLIGAIMSFVVMLVFAVTKFADGAWIVVILIPAMVFLFFRIHAHYKGVARALSMSNERVANDAHPVATIVLVDDVHKGTMRITNFAKSMGRPWIALHVALDPEKSDRVEQKWHARMTEGELHMIPSPYRRLVEPIRDFVLAQRDAAGKDAYVHVIMGQLVMGTTWERILHSNQALGVKQELERYDRVIVTEVPYQLYDPDDVVPEPYVPEHRSGEGMGELKAY